MTKPKSKSSNPSGTVFGPTSLARVPAEWAKGRVASAPLVELKTRRLPKRPRCPKCMMRPADSSVRIGVVTIEVCSDCAKPVEDGLDFFKRSMDFIETLKRFL